jgi:hypothetical protein
MAVRERPGLNHVLHGELPCDPEKVSGRSRGLEKRRRSELDGGGRGNSGSGEWVAQLEQHAARGGVVVHREGLKLLGARGIRCPPSGGNGGRRRLG